MSLAKTAPCAAVLKALADDTRLEIVRDLMSGPRHVYELSSSTRMTQPLFSHHLAVLRKSGIVIATRDGKAMLYSLAVKTKSSKTRTTLLLGCCSIEFNTKELENP